MRLMGRRRKSIRRLAWSCLRFRGLMWDGRRRTHQSGPLGELFDHGVDAVNTSLECLIFAASQNLGMGWKTVMTLFACMPGSAFSVSSSNAPQLFSHSTYKLGMNTTRRPSHSA
jgi:hypothetical protein